MEFNRKPNQCEDCPLQQEKVDSNNIVLTRNCDGPKFGEHDYQSRTTVEAGVVTAIDKAAAGKYGKAVCTNAGMVLWLKSAEQAFEAQQNL